MDAFDDCEDEDLLDECEDICSDCAGAGWVTYDDDPDGDVCPTCNGTGYLVLL